MEKTLKEKWAEKTSEIIGKKTIGFLFILEGPQAHCLTAEAILAIIEAYEEAQRIVAKEEALELTQRFAHELPGIVDCGLPNTNKK
jgi:hypothetical protein